MTLSLDRSWRDERARIVASLARRFGDLTIAEDAVQEAFAAAASRWDTTGAPERPGAWLATTAYRKAVDMVRRRRPTTPLDTESGLPTMSSEGSDADDPHVLGHDDDLFTLLVTCCHPALPPEARVALTLRHVCGLTTAEIAAAFVVGVPAMTKRLVRARRKIVDAGIRFEPPTSDDLNYRSADVRAVIYLVFSEGHLSSGTEHAVRVDLCAEAVWLARQLHQLRPHDDETRGLLALLLTQHARRDARLDAAGQLIPFTQQRRDSWDHDAIAEARALLAGVGDRRLGPYQVEAAIALLHVAPGGPDWSRIADLHGVLSRLAPSPLVDLNRALAVGRSDGARAGLALLAPVLRDGRLRNHAPLFAVHADLLEAAGDLAGAMRAWEHGAQATDNPAQRAAMHDHAERLRSEVDRT